jgi:hypothetical protein
MKDDIILSYLELIEEISRQPLYNSLEVALLEVGFRHSPLNIKEQLDRYAVSCAQINHLVQRMIKELQDGN